jgi:hypothetical protein
LREEEGDGGGADLGGGRGDGDFRLTRRGGDAAGKQGKEEQEDGFHLRAGSMGSFSSTLDDALGFEALAAQLT